MGARAFHFCENRTLLDHSKHPKVDPGLAKWSLEVPRGLGGRRGAKNPGGRGFLGTCFWACLALDLENRPAETTFWESDGMEWLSGKARLGVPTPPWDPTVS